MNALSSKIDGLPFPGLLDVTLLLSKFRFNFSEFLPEPFEAKIKSPFIFGGVKKREGENLGLAASPNVWAFYAFGFFLIALGVAFILIPLVVSSGVFSNVKIPWIILYVYRSGNFYFATSPILIILSVAALLFYFVRR